MKKEYFTSRLGFVLSLMGVAVGAGNIWRFSRVVAQNGGGSFIIPWIIFLFIWSIPLIIAEIALGKWARKGPIGALAKVGGRSHGWMGAFVALVATGILFYYSVVVGWGLSYFYYSISGKILPTTDFSALWHSYQSSYLPFFFHLLSISIGTFVVYKGVVKGIERSNKILIPMLLAILGLLLIRALTLPRAFDGMRFLFVPHLSDLLNYRVWLEALTQNAWDTGAGWGLLLVYACYARKEESITLNGALTAFANNAISLIFAITLFATLFSLEHEAGISKLISGEASSATGLTFIYLPKLFVELPGGFWVHSFFSAIFFLSFFAAALSSMISMVQMTSQVISELGMPMKKAILFTGFLGLLFGTPSSLNMKFFEHQDWVWGVGLIVSGLFIALAICRYGVDRFRKEVINSVPGDLKMGKSYNYLLTYFIPAQALILLGWYFYQTLKCEGLPSLLSLLLQWGGGMLLFLIFNRWLVKRSLQERE